jgi:von Willebrand factor type A C-terminal domain
MTSRCRPVSTSTLPTTPARPSSHRRFRGLEARRQGDKDTAEAKLGRVVGLAHQSGNEETAKLLAKVVDVVDATTGTVQLKKKVEDADEMALDTRSTKTVRTRK